MFILLLTAISVLVSCSKTGYSAADLTEDEKMALSTKKDKSTVPSPYTGTYRERQLKNFTKAVY